jgi:two-component system alkaline phosphatase synthesis response regulator PhoP
MAGELILVVDDEPNIIQLARIYLKRAGFRVESSGNGLATFEIIDRLHPDLVVLDIMLPGMDGLEICKKLRAIGNTVPIILLTARDEDIDKILGLELGADDYLTKPFNPHELVARIKAILRRLELMTQHSRQALRLGNLVIDPDRREVTINGKPIELRTQEFELLWVLIEHKGLVLSREQLLNLAWGYDYAGETRTVDVHIGQIRKKIAGSGIAINTITGVGYKLVLNQDERDG